MKYVVTGHHRGGTSALMRCLEKGGMRCLYDRGMRPIGIRNGYDPNPHGFFEQTDPTPTDGCVVKLFSGQLGAIDKQTMVAFIRRSASSVVKSGVSGYGRDVFTVDGVESVYNSIVRICKHKGARMTVLHYETLVQEPEKTLSRLAADGWPIIVADAVAGIDGKLKRN